MADIVVDSNILISLFKTSEDAFHLEANAFAEEVAKRGDRIRAPAIALWEIGCATNHPVNRPRGQLLKGPQTPIHWVDVTQALWESTWKPEAVAVRALDWIYVSVAKTLSAPLVTRDQKLLTHSRRLGAIAVSVDDYLAGTLSG